MKKVCINQRTNARKIKKAIEKFDSSLSFAKDCNWKLERRHLWLLMRVINTLENPSIKAVFYKQPRRFFKVVFVQFVNNKHQRIMIKCGKLKVMLVACDIVTLTKYIIYINILLELKICNAPWSSKIEMWYIAITTLKENETVWILSSW